MLQRHCSAAPRSQLRPWIARDTRGDAPLIFSADQLELRICCRSVRQGLVVNRLLYVFAPNSEVHLDSDAAVLAEPTLGCRSRFIN